MSEPVRGSSCVREVFRVSSGGACASQGIQMFVSLATKINRSQREARAPPTSTWKRVLTVASHYVNSVTWRQNGRSLDSCRGGGGDDKLTSNQKWVTSHVASGSGKNSRRCPETQRCGFLHLGIMSRCYIKTANTKGRIGKYTSATLESFFRTPQRCLCLSLSRPRAPVCAPTAPPAGREMHNISLNTALYERNISV